MGKKYIETWDKIAEKFEEGKIAHTHPEQEVLLLQEMEVKSSVLDVGCATGKHTLFLASKGFDATGSDLSEEMVRIAKQKASKEGSSAKFVVEDATVLTFEDKSFDYVISFGNTLGSIPGKDERRNALKEMLRVGRKKLILELLKSDTVEEVRSKYTFLGEEESYPAKRWDEEEITEALKTLGYEARIQRGRKSVIADYFFYVIVDILR
ncbi:MAG: class I SAM-dependent methyltransferase [Candidatus Spechtbacterales bacterium]